MASKRKVGSKCRTFWVAALFLASISAIITIAVIQDKWRVQKFEYGIVIDSGSSRSSIYLYKWPGEKQNETGVVSEVKNCRVAGNGISEMKKDPEKDKASWKGFDACMKNITREIPAEKHNNTPIFLGATAGMRLLHEMDRNRSDEILLSLKEYLMSLPFNFQNASILTGQEEGLYGWVTVNYLMGNFVEKNLWNAFVRPEGVQTVGSMDLGGASTQLAFVVDGEMQGEDYLPVRLYGYDYNVYTHSYLCYGKNEAEKQILDRIIKASKGATNIQNPCYPEGYTGAINASAIYDSPCTKKPDNYDPNMTFFFTGVPDTEKCRELVRTLFDFKKCPTEDCSFNGVQQPPVKGDFMAYAGFFFTSRALLLNKSSEMEQFNSSCRDFCHTHWSVLKVTRPWISERYLKTYCYSAYYIFTLLAEGYKFDPDTWKHISFEKEVKNTNVGWSLGYMLSMSNMIPSEAGEILPMSSSLFTGLIFLFSALIIITLVFLCIMLVRTCY
ncbi:Ectonucleoside triphosphate diphosphohydrolase 3 [Merluccius polli]|uniref:Ectonucleoside triphosphate diphosphohydrolase 3 n=1 Tax=Merluccius polli TaxID=89951 RepID=A0AA47MYM7_MERPO|nr:Ectonucleoside triphosphate diphosphohydrolase 3 [Merluccius polli]